MQITVVAIMCHTLGAISQPVCREEIVVKDDMPMQACFLSQPALAGIFAFAWPSAERGERTS